MKRIESLEDLFTHWRRQTDKYAALNQLRAYYDEQKDIIVAPYQRKLFEHVESHGASSITIEIRKSLYSEISDDMKQLIDWHGRMTKEIIEYYDK